MKINPITLSSQNLSDKKYNVAALNTQNLSVVEGCLSNKSVNAATVLAQMPNVSFCGEFARDYIKACRLPDGKMPSSTEMKKYTLSLEVNRDMANRDYLSALLGKVAIANVTKGEGSNIIGLRDDIDREIIDLYAKLPQRQRVLARAAIIAYSDDLKESIDEIPPKRVRSKKTHDFKF